MNAEVHVLFVSASVADETVLTTLLARAEAGEYVRLSAVASASAFFDALHAERRYQVIVVDERQTWTDWQEIAASCVQSRPNALLVLLAASDQTPSQDGLLAAGMSAAYPRNSAGLIGLSGLIGKLAAQERVFSLRHDAADIEADAEQAGREDRERLVYAVSHDLQDPLQLAKRYADILNDDFERELGESGSKLLGHLQFNLARTQEMLDELLEYSRLQTAAPDRQPVDFNELLDEVVALYKLQLDEIGGTVARQHTLPTLAVDRRQFLRVLQNLIGNAIKFRGEQPLHVSVRAQRVRNEWRIGIKDNGIGIAEEDAKRIFGMFERAGGAERYPGTGMGLAICKRIIQNHGGRIWVRSSPGSGSVFIFSVPQPGDA